MVIRNTSENQELAVTDCIWNVLHSLLSKLPGTKAMPAAIICQAVFTVADLEVDLYLEYKEPPAQLMAPMISTMSPITWPPLPVPNALEACSLNNRITPIKPTINPN